MRSRVPDCLSLSKRPTNISLSDFPRNIDSLFSVRLCVDLCYRQFRMPKNYLRSLNTELLSNQRCSRMPKLVWAPSLNFRTITRVANRLAIASRIVLHAWRSARPFRDIPKIFARFRLAASPFLAMTYDNLEVSASVTHSKNISKTS